MKVTLYTIHCPACNILERKLNSKNVPFVVVDDIDTLKEKGLEKEQFPLLQIDNEPIMKYKEANLWINNLEVSNG